MHLDLIVGFIHCLVELAPNTPFEPFSALLVPSWAVLWAGQGPKMGRHFGAKSTPAGVLYVSVGEKAPKSDFQNMSIFMCVSRASQIGPRRPQVAQEGPT